MHFAQLLASFEVHKLCYFLAMRYSLFLISRDVELEEDDVLVFDDIVLALLSVLARFFDCICVFIMRLPIGKVADLRKEQQAAA